MNWINLAQCRDNCPGVVKSNETSNALNAGNLFTYYLWSLSTFSNNSSPWMLSCLNVFVCCRSKSSFVFLSSQVSRKFCHIPDRL